MGQVSAAMAAQILVDDYQVCGVINVGVASGLHPSLKLGDVLYASNWFEEEAQHVACREAMASKVVEGTIYQAAVAEDDAFDGRLQVIGAADTLYHTYCDEMVAGVVAHVCVLNQRKYMIIRTISDIINQNVEMNFEAFVHQITRQESKILEQVLAYVS